MEGKFVHRWSATVQFEVRAQVITAVADGLLWIMGQPALHYLDDFLLIGASDSQQCVVALQTSLELCETLSIPVAAPKVEGPATVLPFPGILIDSGNGVLELPSDKLLRLKRLIRLRRGKKKCKKQELLSLIGQLSHACRVVRAGRTFLHHMIDLSSVPKELNHWVHLIKVFSPIYTGGQSSWRTGMGSPYSVV